MDTNQKVVMRGTEVKENFTIHQYCQTAFLSIFTIYGLFIYLTISHDHPIFLLLSFIFSACCCAMITYTIKKIEKFKYHFKGHASHSKVILALISFNILAIFFFVPFLFSFIYQTQISILFLLLLSGICLYLFNRFPEIIIKSIIYWAFKCVYRVQLKGVEHYPKKDERILIIVNHVSFLDVLLLSAFLPDNLSFIGHDYYTKKRWLKLFLRFTPTYTVNYPFSNLLIVKTIIRDIKEHACRCIIFPEGKISTTGTLMKIYEGPGLIADKAQAAILPIFIEGAQYTYFTKKANQLPRRFLAKISITIFAKQSVTCDQNIQGRARRKILSYQISDMMAESMLSTRHFNNNMFLSLLEAKSKYGGNQIILEDMNWQTLTYQQFITKCFILGRNLRHSFVSNEFIGILLPNSIPAIVVFFSLYIYGKVPAILNFTLGKKILFDSLKLANVQTIITSKQFVEKAQLTDLLNDLAAHYNIVYLEDVKNNLSLTDKLIGFFSGRWPQLAYYFCHPKTVNEEVAVLLFTSGTESIPKAVLLSHTNIQTNCFQLYTRFDFHHNDVAFNALPLFHAFGFLGAVMPLLLGVRTFCYPTPLHYRIIPEFCYDVGASILYATDTFLKHYATRAHPYDFYKMRYVFTGAERLKTETQALWFTKFGIRIFEGYGITETGPVIASNTMMNYKPGTVGRFLPMVEYRLERVDGIEDLHTGRLFVKGPNIMMGYLERQDKDIKLVPPTNGWHDTGDIVQIDSLGYVTILGRVKRFAKIAGEMVSLNAIEQYATLIKNQYIHSATYLPDSKRGEMIVLLTECRDLIKNDFINYYQLNQISMIHLPKAIYYIKSVPKTATGKVDYQAVKQLALDLMSE